jgi:UDP-glucose 4-epimerase
MENIARGKSPVIFGDGLQTMDFIFVEDVARANVLAARAPVTDRVYNIATGAEVSLNECADLLLKAMDSSLPIEYAPARKVNPVPRRLADVWRAQQEIGFQAVISFEDGLRRLVEWWRQMAEATVAA